MEIDRPSQPAATIETGQEALARGAWEASPASSLSWTFSRVQPPQHTPPGTAYSSFGSRPP